MENLNYCKNGCGRTIDKKYNEYFNRGCEQFRDICCRKCNIKDKNKTHTDKCKEKLKDDINTVIKIYYPTGLKIYDIYNNDISDSIKNFDGFLTFVESEEIKIDSINKFEYNNIEIMYRDVEKNGIEYLIKKLEKLEQIKIIDDFDEKKEEDEKCDIVTFIRSDNQGFINFYVLYKKDDFKTIIENYRKVDVEINDTNIDINNIFNISEKQKQKIQNLINDDYKLVIFFGRRYGENLNDYSELNDLYMYYNCLYKDKNEKIEYEETCGIYQQNYDKNNIEHIYKTLKFGYSWYLSLLIDINFISCLDLDLCQTYEISELKSNSVIEKKIDNLEMINYTNDYYEYYKKIFTKLSEDKNYNYFYNEFMKIIDTLNIDNPKNFFKILKDNKEKFRTLHEKLKTEMNKIKNFIVGGNRDNYYNKYLKYKNKYLKLKNENYLF